MAIFKRGAVYWYEFVFQGVRIRESTRSTNKELALRCERDCRRRLELGANALEGVKRPVLFCVSAAEWAAHQVHASRSTQRINRTNLDHLMPHFGKTFVNSITPQQVVTYQSARMKDGAAPKTINLEIATLRQVVRHEGHWGRLDGKVKMLRVVDKVGRALTPDEMDRLEAAARKSRSRSLPVALVIYRFTGLRFSELRLMRWRQIDLISGYLTTGTGSDGDAKTRAGAGRKIPLSLTPLNTLKAWRILFPEALPDHFVFPSERYGLNGEEGYLRGSAIAYDIRPDRPISSWKVAWDACRKAAGVSCRLHDYRHSFVSCLAENPQVSDATLMALTGHVSRRMLEHYSHTRDEAKRKAVESLDRGAPEASPQYPPQ